MRGSSAAAIMAWPSCVGTLTTISLGRGKQRRDHLLSDSLIAFSCGNLLIASMCGYPTDPTTS
jgi:hypothetical protein